MNTATKILPNFIIYFADIEAIFEWNPRCLPSLYHSNRKTKYVVRMLIGFDRIVVPRSDRKRISESIMERYYLGLSQINIICEIIVDLNMKSPNQVPKYGKCFVNRIENITKKRLNSNGSRKTHFTSVRYALCFSCNSLAGVLRRVLLFV